MGSFSIAFRTTTAPDQGHVQVLDLHGELDAHTAAELEAALEKCIAEGQRRILVNGSHLQYISSAGLGVFMAHVEDVRAMGGDIKIAALPPRVYNVFDLLGFPMLFDITAREEDAIERFASADGATPRGGAAAP